MAKIVPITLPPMGESVSEGTVAAWRKKPGESVAEGDVVAEVTTDKVDMEITAPAAGTLTRIVADEGQTVAIGALLAELDSEVVAPVISNAPSSEKSLPPAAAEQITPPSPSPPTAAAPLPTPPATNGPANGAAPSGSQVINASPLARRAAAIRGMDLTTVAGTGPAGMIRRGDVDTQSVAQAITPRPTVSSDAAASNGGPRKREAPKPSTTILRGPAGALATAMEQSREIPTATSIRTVEVRVLEQRRSQLKTALEAAGRADKVSFTHIIGYAVALATLDFPSMSCHFERDADGKPTKVQTGIHLGLAVDTQRKDGSRFLVVPVVRDAATRDFASFRDEYERLVERARNNSLIADELQGASITLTNPGGLGTLASVPRLMTGQGTIIAVGSIDFPPGLRAAARAQLSDLSISKVMTLTSTYDHRVIQGAESGSFLARVEELLQGGDEFYEDIFQTLGLPVPLPVDLTTVTGVAAPPGVPSSRTALADHNMMAAVSAGMSLVKAHRTHGHLGAHLDPLGSEPSGDPAMDPKTVHLTPELMQQIPADIFRTYVPAETLADIIPRLRETYCGTIAYEIEHIASHHIRVWLREHIETGMHRTTLSPTHRLHLLQRLLKVDTMEHYLRRVFPGQKTFSIEGLDAMVPMLDELFNLVINDGVGQAVMGMAHRGRLAVIAHIVNQPYETVLATFEHGEQRRPLSDNGGNDLTGDVKYHASATGIYVAPDGKSLSVRLLPNPSHLEAIDGVVEGWTRAIQTQRGAPTIHVDPMAAMPVLIHGDAAFPGQGVVAEVLNLSALEGYTTGGTVHIIANNQIGFTTEAAESRSTRYASDLAKGFDIPIIHVNADDIDACISAMRLAHEYRRTYHRDVVIDLVGYRRFGHNETDEPSYTQPLMYQRIKDHPSAVDIFAQQLVDEGLNTREQIDTMRESMNKRLAEAHGHVKDAVADTEEELSHSRYLGSVEEIPTGVSASTIESLNDQLTAVPEGFSLNPKLMRQIERRRTSLHEGEIDWGTAESLAFASLLLQGKPIRLTGQDTERGTFSQRHIAFHDVVTGARWIPMQHLVDAAATFEVHNSPLSEFAALSFEYGYSSAASSAMVLWEAQFGDFVNNAQTVIDSFVVSGMAKWGQESRLVLLLPHGSEGMGPEHSSGRLERFLKLAAHGNIRVANCSTAGQYFHLLRQQALSVQPRPLIIMTPKKLLRLKDSMTSLPELGRGHFQQVIDDPVTSNKREAVRAVLLCSGKIYYDLIGNSMRGEDVAIVRVEQLEPLEEQEIVNIVRSYSNARRAYWVQEEPENMGAWEHVGHAVGALLASDIKWGYIGRSRRASPSEGYTGAQALEQERIVTLALSAGRGDTADTVTLS